MFFPSHFPSSKYFLCYRKTMQWATWCFLKFFWHFWLWAYSFLSEPGCWTLKSWVFRVNEKHSLSEWFWLPRNCANLHPEKFHPSNFTSTKLFLCYNKRMQWAAWVFFSFSFIFGCSLTVFSVHLDASHWNLEFFGFTQTTFFVHPKNSRFQCSASRFTEKTVSSQPKMPEKLKKTSRCSLHSFPGV